jgi:hypothetical protein
LPAAIALIYTMMAQFEEDFTRRIRAGEFATAKEAQEAAKRAAQTPPGEPASPRRP